jgi:uncharacterized protein (DUF2249 family)
MSQVSETIHNHHQELLATLTGYSQALAEGQTVDASALAAFLKNDLIPHAAGEEQHLYPAIDPLVKAYGKATATMSVDHEFIEGYVRQIEETALALNQAENAQRPALEKQLQRLTLQLEAVLRVHLEKEERVYIPLFEQYVSSEDQQRILDGMHEAYDESGDVKTLLDVRPILPPQRHVLIFQTFESLHPGEAFELVNDHDPKPLYYQFKFEREGRFTWDYLEQGPQVWRVRIGKRENE